MPEPPLKDFSESLILTCNAHYITQPETGVMYICCREAHEGLVLSLSGEGATKVTQAQRCLKRPRMLNDSK